jgi:hypothetical protein
MAITANPNDKYAFLFSGSANGRFIKDLENVAQTLVEFYNYPPAQVMVVLGEMPAPLPTFSGATVTGIGSLAELSNALGTTFAGMAAGANRTALLYFTGGGLPAAAGATSARLAITGGAAPPTIDAAWLVPRLNALSPAQVNVVMQQSHAGGFQSAFSDPAFALAEWSFTYACAAGEQSLGDSPPVKGSFFTHAWTRALKLEPLPGLAPDAGQHADELGAGTEATNRLVSLQEALVFAKQIHDHVDGLGAWSTPGYLGPAAGGSLHLGLPSFLIRDGSPWWESPDILLTHPNHPWVPQGDLYIADPVGATAPFNNTVNVVVRNTGCHPVRAYRVHLELFHTGGGGTSIAHDADQVLSAPAVLKPVDPAEIGLPADATDTYLWNTLFVETASHRCVKAEAALVGPIDVGWSVQARDSEAQRNIDLMAVVPDPPMPPPLPELQGHQEHTFGVFNRFTEPAGFVLAMQPEFRELEEAFGLRWFALPEGAGGQAIEVDLKSEPLPHLAFDLEPKEQATFLLRARPAGRGLPKEGLRIPFEIWAKGRWPKDARRKHFEVDMPDLAPVAGFTVVLEAGVSALWGTVFDRSGKPLAEARVHAQTVNRRQEGTVVSDGKGTFAFEAINPGVYRVWAEFGKLQSEEQMVVLLADRKEEVKLVLAAWDEEGTRQWAED